MPRQDLVTAPADPMLVPEAAHKFAQRALREHQRAEKNVMKAVEHVVKSGELLLKAYDLCEYGQWEGFFEMHFKQNANPDDGTRPLTLRTGYKYMQLARDWSRLVAQHPDGFSSQRQAFKALAALAREEKPKALSGTCAARGATGGKRARSGPVWRASGPFVKEAWHLVTSVDAELSRLVDEGFPLEPEATKIHAALERLQTMLDREIDEAEALHAAGEWTFVAEQIPPTESRPLSIDIESEDDHDD